MACYLFLENEDRTESRVRDGTGKKAKNHVMPGNKAVSASLKISISEDLQQ